METFWKATMSKAGVILMRVLSNMAYHVGYFVGGLRYLMSSRSPAAFEITSEIIDGKDCIMCRQCAVGEFWITELLELFPESMWMRAKSFYPADVWDGPEPLVDQRYSWSGYYTDKKW